MNSGTGHGSWCAHSPGTAGSTAGYDLPRDNQPEPPPAQDAAGLVGEKRGTPRANAQIEEQARIEAAYEQQRRLNELKNQFVLNVSHELRTPLTQVYGYLELLGTFHDTLTSEKRVGYIHQATQGCETLLLLINTILHAVGTGSHMTPPQAQELVVADLVHEVLEEFERGRSTPSIWRLLKGLSSRPIANPYARCCAICSPMPSNILPPDHGRGCSHAM